MITQEKVKNILLIVLLFLVALPLIIPLLKSGMFISDDGNWMIIRLSDFHRSMVDGQFPVRWAGRLNHQFGYTVFNFLYPGVYYLGELIHLFKFNYVNSIKILFGLSIVGSLAFSFLWLKEKFTKKEAIIGSLVYVYFPYHIYDIYKRGSLGEALGFAVLPLVLWSINAGNIFIGSISIALLILVHNTFAMLSFLLIIPYAFFAKTNLKRSLFMILIGLGISAFFWIPALIDKQYTVFDSVNVSNWSEFFINGETFNLIGFGTVLIGILSLFRSIVKKEKVQTFFLSFFIGSLCLSLPISDILWKILPLPSFVQFPWRFLSLTTITSAFLTAYLLHNLKPKMSLVIGGMLIVTFSFQTLPFLKNLTFEVKEEGYYSTNEGSTTVKNEYMPKWVTTPMNQRAQNRVEIIKGNGRVNITTQNSRIIKGRTESSEDINVRINKVYFPGWYAKIDQLDVPIRYKDMNGVMNILVSKGNHNFEVVWKETPIRLFADLISIVSYMSLVCIYALNKLRNKKS